MPSRLPAPESLEEAVLFTVLYGDLFDHALNLNELRRYLVVEATEDELSEAVESLERRGWLLQQDRHVVWRDRLALVDLRHERRERSRLLWAQAREFAEALARIPFLRMVAVCGSLAVENPVQDADIDLFLVTEEDRLWIVQAHAMRHRHRAARRGIDACPNYFLTVKNLGLLRRDLHTAREVAHIVPLWGQATYESFLTANRWVYQFFPNLDLADRRRFLAEPARPVSTARWESRLEGRPGDLLDRALHQILLLYYPLRLRRRGVAAAQIRTAYRRDRQEVVGGGYAPAIRERFLAKVSEALGEETRRAAAERLFPQRPPHEGPVALYSQQLTERYGDRP